MAQESKYLISFIATLKGGKLVASGLKQIQQSQKAVGTQAGKTGKQMQGMSGIMLKAGKRALIVAPMWLALRSAMMLVLRTITMMAKSVLDFESGIARIETVVHGTAEQIRADMATIRSTILNMSTKTSVSLEKLTEAFYFLKTAGLDTEESIAGFNATVTAMVATGTNAQEMARAVAGIYNTMGESIGENLSVQEKFTKIVDTLTYVYATQDVQMQELIQSYTKLAPFISGLDDSFEEIVITLGFLNTRMLRSGRTGRLLARSIIQIVSKTKQLAEIFNVTFDPNKPISFLNVFRQIRKTLGDTTKLTARQSEALQRIFGIRGVTAVKLILDSFADLDETILKGIENIEGFNQKLADIRENTAKAQFGRVTNALKRLTIEFAYGTQSVGKFTNAIRNMADRLEGQTENMREFARALGYVSYLAERLDLSDIFTPLTFLGAPHKTIGALKDYIETLRSLFKGEGLPKAEKIKTPKELFEETEKFRQEREKEASLIKKENEIEQKAQEISLLRDKQREEALRHQIALMKTRGVHSLEIARFKLKELELAYGISEVAEHQLELDKQRNIVAEEEVKHRQELFKLFQTGTIKLLQSMGVSESAVVEAQIQQLKLTKDMLKPEAYLVRLAQLRLNQQLALVSEKRKELKVQASLAKAYEDANETETKRLDQVFKLSRLSPVQLSREFQRKSFDRSLIDDYTQYYTKKQLEAIEKTRAKELRQRKGAKGRPSDVPTEAETQKIEEIMSKYQDLLSGSAVSFWNTWDIRSELSVSMFADSFKSIIKDSIDLLVVPEKEKIPQETTASALKTTGENVVTGLREIGKTFIEGIKEALQLIPAVGEVAGATGAGVGKVDLKSSGISEVLWDGKPIEINNMVKSDIRVQAELKGTSEEILGKFAEDAKKKILGSAELKDKIKKAIGEY